MNERPWRLEVWEFDPDTIEEEWRMWSTYVTEANAIARRDKLVGKGYTARVVNGAGEPQKCDLCGESHHGPSDGSCLL